MDPFLQRSTAQRVEIVNPSDMRSCTHSHCGTVVGALFPGELHASAMSKAGGKHKAANDIRIPNLPQWKSSVP